MALQIQSSLLLIPGQQLLILMPFYRVLSIFHFKKFMNYLPRLMTLDNAVSKQAGNGAWYFSISFYPTSRPHHDVRALHIPFLHNFKGTVPLNEVCFYCHINWPLAQDQQLSSLGFPQSSTSIRGCKARPKADFQFHVKRQPVPDSMVQHLKRR